MQSVGGLSAVKVENSKEFIQCCKSHISKGQRLLMGLHTHIKPIWEKNENPGPLGVPKANLKGKSCALNHIFGSSTFVTFFFNWNIL